MSPNTIKIAKAVTAAVWVVLAASFFCPHDSLLLPDMRLFYWVLLGVHAIECLVFLPALRRSGKPLAGQLVQILLFGVIHYASLREEGAG